MATKQEKAVKSAVTREKKKGILREERHVLYLLIAIILFLLYLLFAQHNGWWPYSRPNLGTAFYTNVSANETAAKSTTDTTASDDGTNDAGGDSGTSNTGGNSGGGNTGGSGSSNNGGGSNSGGGNTGGSETTPADSLVDLAANINVGDTKTHVGAQAKNLGENCAVILDAQTQNPIGKQEVCTYTQGDKIITVTYLNDRVVSASKTGF